MQSDSDINKTKSTAVEKNRLAYRRVQDYLRRTARSITGFSGRFIETISQLSDFHKAAAAVLVLIASLITLVHETKALHAPDPVQISPEAVSVGAAARDSAQSAAAELIQSGISTDLWDARAYLESSLNHESSSLRQEYAEILDRGEGASFHPETEAERTLWEKVRRQRKISLSKAPYLILVNKWHYLPEDYTADPVTLPNGQLIGSDCYEPLMQMLEDCEEAGGKPIVCSGFRPHDQQVYLFGEQIKRWLNAGYGQEDSEDLAATAVAVPGTSEHELGLAADIYSSENMSLDESQVDTFTQQWLMENCWRYGFILRYPKDKSDITGIIFEPWHYRYVGNDHAKKIYDAGICLEEYLEETDHPEE